MHRITVGRSSGRVAFIPKCTAELSTTLLVPPPAVQVPPPAPPPAPQFAPAAAPASAAPVAAPQPVAAAFDYEKRAAEQLDFIDESDDAVVVFEREDGSLYWVVGHVEYINLAKSDINLRNISDACLQRLKKDPVIRVSIDDPRAVFVYCLPFLR